LLGPSEFRDVVSGRARGTAASLARAGLRVLEWPYTAAVRFRNWRYDTHRASVARIGVPVVSVGNITMGGTGKTPAVEWLARWFAEQGVRVALVSRGYGAKPGRPNDESLELAQKLPSVPHVLDRDRVRGARQAIVQFGCQLIVLDDAFQHRRLHRDLDIVLVDALEPFGFGHVFPRGTLREPLDGWNRAHVVMLTRAELVNEPARASIRASVAQRAPAAIWVEATYAPRALVSADGQERPLADLAGKRVAAFCGIGNPAGFRHSLARTGCELVALREFADHFAYAPCDVEALARWADSLGVAGVVCTSKDLVKIGDRWPGATPLWGLAARLQIVAGQEPFEAALRSLIGQARGG
jgi:tetraacyldisaccharide 4'-kinase